MLAYCDKIAAEIRSKLIDEADTPDGVLAEVATVQMDLHPTEGWFPSTKKVLQVWDRNGKAYTVTVEEAE